MRLTSLAYPAYRAGERLACLLPAALVPSVSRAAAALATVTMPRRRRMVARHLQRVRATELAPGERRRAVRAAFRSYADYWLDTFRMCRIDHTDLDARVRVDGLAILDSALNAGRGAVLAAPHLGSWDLGGAWLASRGYPLVTVVEHLRSPRLLKWFVEVRRRLGMQVVVRGPDVWEELENALRQNRVVALVCDRDLSRRGVPVTFFGERTTMPPGPPRLARKCGAALLPVAIYSEAGASHRGVIRPPVAVKVTNDEHADVAATAQLLAHELEALIRADPEQWHLMQPNWPSDEN